ncbi:MAG: hypothetical protein R6V85_01180 [Polyangia bacterium]
MRWNAERTDLLLFCLAAAITALALLRALGNDLVWDDRFLILGAEELGETARLHEILTTPFWQNSSHVAELLLDYWRPLTTLALWTGAAAFGDWAPGFHLISLLAALGAALLLARLMRLAIGEPHLAVRWLAVLFLAHPLAAEVICLTANLADHLVLIFASAAVIAVYEAARAARPARRLSLLAAAGLACACACASKELGLVAVLAPAAAFALRRCVDRRAPFRELLAPGAWIAVAAPAAAYLVSRHLVLDSAAGASGALPGISDYLRTAFFGLGEALASIFVPIPSGARVSVEVSNPVAIGLAALAWGAVLALFFRSVFRRRLAEPPLIGVSIAVALLLPSLLAVESTETSIVFPRRYFHPPLAGILVCILPFAVRRWRAGARYVLPLLVSLLALLSWIRVDEWSDNVSFFQAEAHYNPDSAEARLSYARSLTRARSFDRAERLLDEVDEMPAAQQPRLRVELLNERAALKMLRDGDTRSAARLLERALVLDPTDLGSVLDLASVHATAGRPGRAARILRTALRSPWFRDHRRAEIEARLRRYEQMERRAASDRADRPNAPLSKDTSR